jgi:hypothetical protein
MTGPVRAFSGDGRVARHRIRQRRERLLDAARTSGPAATKALVLLLKQARQLAETIRQRSDDPFAQHGGVGLLVPLSAA